MNKRDRARLTMAENSDQFLDNNLAEVKELPRFAETKSKLEQSIEGANEAAKDADDTDGDSDKKEAVKDELLEAAMEVITPIKLLAKFNNDPLLLNKADNPYSTLDKMSVKALATRCAVILDLAKANDATEYRQTPEKIATFEQLLEEFNEVAGTPRLSISERKEANIRFKRCVDDAVDLLNEIMDDLMELIKKENPKLYEGYNTVRIIIG